VDTNITDGKLIKCEMMSAELNNVRFINCDLSDTSFNKAKMENVIFQNCIFNNTKISKAFLGKNIIFNNTTVIKENDKKIYVGNDVIQGII